MDRVKRWHLRGLRGYGLQRLASTGAPNPDHTRNRWIHPREHVSPPVHRKYSLSGVEGSGTAPLARSCIKEFDQRWSALRVRRRPVAVVGNECPPVLTEKAIPARVPVDVADHAGISDFFDHRILNGQPRPRLQYRGRTQKRTPRPPMKPPQHA